MLARNKITILPIGMIIDDLKVTKDHLFSIINNNKNKELLGMFCGKSSTSKFDPLRISHIINNFSFNNILNSLEASIDFIQSPFGDQLKMIFKQDSSKILWMPQIIIEPDKIIIKSIHAKLKDIKCLL